MSILNELHTLITAKHVEMDAWFAQQFSRTQPFVYNSVDIRNAGFKAAPVDTNIFPAGFNNLNAREEARASAEFAEYIARYYPGTQRIAIVMEDHTRNRFYLENVRRLEVILRAAGFLVQSTSVAAHLSQQTHILMTAVEEPLTIFSCTREGEQLHLPEGFLPDLVLINNDLTSGLPALLENLAQPMIPPVELGWFRRRKTSHFETYNTLAAEFGEHFGVDPWRISTFFHRCGRLNFKERTGLECLADGVETVLAHIRRKYHEYGITETPYVFIKSDMGTYGMGIMTARSGKELLSLNKELRNKMTTIKGGEKNTEVIIQEGVPSMDRIEGHVAEPMLYLVGGKPVGCLYRINTEKDAYENLNSQGMRFEPMQHGASPDLCPSLGLLARLASFAAAWECYEVSYTI